VGGICECDAVFVVREFAVVREFVVVRAFVVVRELAVARELAPAGVRSTPQEPTPV
jgi:hypothetical protein